MSLNRVGTRCAWAGKSQLQRPVEGPDGGNSTGQGVEVQKRLGIGGPLSSRECDWGWKREGNGEAWSEPASPQTEDRCPLCWEKPIMKEEFGKQFGKRLQKASNSCHFLFYATDSDLNHPGLEE